MCLATQFCVTFAGPSGKVRVLYFPKADTAELVAKARRPGIALLQKPFTTEALGRKILEVLDG